MVGGGISSNARTPSLHPTGRDLGPTTLAADTQAEGGKWPEGYEPGPLREREPWGSAHPPWLCVKPGQGYRRVWGRGQPGRGGATAWLA